MWGWKVWGTEKGMDGKGGYGRSSKGVRNSLMEQAYRANSKHSIHVDVCLIDF